MVFVTASFSFILTFCLLHNSSNGALRTKPYTHFANKRWTGLTPVRSRSLTECGQLCASEGSGCVGINWNRLAGTCEMITCPKVKVTVGDDPGWSLYISDTHLARYTEWLPGVPSSCTPGDATLVSPMAAGLGTVACSGPEFGSFYPDAADCIPDACLNSANFIAYRSSSDPCRYRSCSVGDDLTPVVDPAQGAWDVYLRIFCV